MCVGILEIMAVNGIKIKKKNQCFAINAEFYVSKTSESYTTLKVVFM